MFCPQKESAIIFLTHNSDGSLSKRIYRAYVGMYFTFLFYIALEIKIIKGVMAKMVKRSGKCVRKKKGQQTEIKMDCRRGHKTAQITGK